MKITFKLLTVVSVLFLSSFDWNGDEILTNSSNLTKSKKEQYHRDATRLALRMLSSDYNFQEIDVEVSHELVNSIYNALISVHMSSIEASKIVTNLHKLHTFPVPSVNNFLVIYKRNIKWASPLRLGDCSTSNERINELCKKYGLVIDNNIEWDDDLNSFNVRSSKALNLTPVAIAFEQIEGVKKIDMLTPSGDGNDIEIVKKDDGWLINYIIKFDSCFKSCKKQHKWTFEVDDSGKVAFLGESGDALPVWMQKSLDR